MARAPVSGSNSARPRKAPGRPRRRAPDADSRVPRYLQVASVLRRRLRDGVWAVGDRIATLEELEREFDVARVTVRQAIDLLQTEGLLRSHQGRGTFVTKSVESSRWLKLATDWESLVSMIRENVPHRLAAGPDGGGPRIAEHEGRPATSYRFLRSLQKRGTEPFGYARVHLSRDVWSKAPRQFAARAALVVLAEMPDLRIARAHQTLTIGAADVETARLLGIALNAPTAEARCVVTDADGVVIYVGEITYRGDCVSLDIELRGPTAVSRDGHSGTSLRPRDRVAGPERRG
ncbi:GntR family transcriptional regulator [Rhodoplanes serenus]|jgi:GntR family transcriptional regulator|uniref:GntR family transcriptional regulator n=1 Tax=Rhodoplanes serenus TaxID=200615 RepID=A0A327K6V3_9BRAD|nr:GntR family transcriptional regulator [Rhodoplanes serenus]MBI5113914.1 GntR family transcriptional regulator [Rhodovulum sp.]MTW14784.1 GntR family transcriptional regulator [Rhodoplanes serenus]RAI34021.1 GntR family transcriptional regulator [Rhodoplanes serenus]